MKSLIFAIGAFLVCSFCLPAADAQDQQTTTSTPIVQDFPDTSHSHSHSHPDYGLSHSHSHSHSHVPFATSHSHSHSHSHTH